MTVTRIRELCSDAETLLEADQAELALQKADEAVAEATRDCQAAALAMAHMIRAWVLQAVERGEEAEQAGAKAAQLAESLCEVDFDQKIVVLKHVSHLWSQLGFVERSQRVANKVLELLIDWHSLEHPQVALASVEMAAWGAIRPPK